MGVLALDEINFGEWLSRRRKSLGLTQKQCAGQVNCATITLRKIEASQRKPSVQVAKRLASAVHIPAEAQGAFIRFARGESSAISLPGEKLPGWDSADSPVLSHLPAPLTRLIGREQDMTALREWLLDESIRLVTLTGPFGIGKTRLGIEVARGLTDSFPGGVCFVPLGNVDVPERLAQVILHSLDHTHHAGHPAAEILSTSIAGKHLLLILDDVEHLIEQAAPLVYEILTACPNLKILATSREPLQVTGEHVYHVSPLEVPSDSQMASMSPEQAAQFPAVKLFIERARAIQPGFSIDQGTIPTVVDLCRKLDGLPLAIELLATRLRLMSPAELRSHLSSQLILHTAGARSLPAHQKTLYHAVKWSYGLLSAEEKQLFTRLSVFTGGVTLHMAEKAFEPAAVGGNVADLIMSLLEKNLLQPSLEKHGVLRFHMLTTTQLFAAEQLQEAGDEQVAHERHLSYFMEFAHQVLNEIQEIGQLTGIRNVEMEQDNLRGALQWSIARKKSRPALQLLTVLCKFWLTCGNYEEMLYWFKQLLSLSDIQEYPSELAQLVSILGIMTPYPGEKASPQVISMEGYSTVGERAFSQFTDNSSLSMLPNHDNPG